MKDYRDILITREKRILRATLNRPDSLNAVSEEMHDELSEFFYDAADDPESDTVILSGAGRAFCAGGDIDWLRRVIAEPPRFSHSSRGVRKIVHGILDCPKPIIARVNGDAVGVGASIALLCDIIIAVDTARFADPHVKVGLVAGDGGAMIWPQLIGFAKAKQYLLTGDPITATEAERIGLINFSVPAAELDVVVDKYAQKLSRGAQVAIRYTKTVTNIALRQLFNSVFEASVAYEGLTQHTADYREGVQAFLDSRHAQFTGS
jgi:enoyl-CoA hydratase/carnithine racemase